MTNKLLKISLLLITEVYVEKCVLVKTICLD